MRLRRDRVAVALEHKVYIYNFADLKLIHHTETLSNPAGLIALSHAPGGCVLACPGLHRGGVRLEWYDAGGAPGAGGAPAGGAPAGGTACSGRRTKFIAAHDGPLAALALTADGGRVATASDKGTLVRVFDAASGAALAELRRGAERATIFSVAFSSASSGGAEWLAASSDKGTVHVWPLPPPGAAAGGAGGAGSGAQTPPPASGGNGSNGSGSGGSSGGKLSFVVRPPPPARMHLHAFCIIMLTRVCPFGCVPLAEGTPAALFQLVVVTRAAAPATRRGRRRRCWWYWWWRWRRWWWRERRQRLARRSVIRSSSSSCGTAQRRRLRRHAAHAPRRRRQRHIPHVRSVRALICACTDPASIAVPSFLRLCFFCAHHIRCTFDPVAGGEVTSEFVRFLDAEGDAEADAEAAAERGGGALGGGGGGTA